jgi:glycosyltransferase involved in cell wall biosynthesis
MSSKRKLKVLISAYACSPKLGSEPGMGWNWIVSLGEYCEVWVITEGEFREDIELSLKSIPHAQNIHFHYLPVSKRVRKMCWNQGDWRFYYYYRRWQKKVYALALDLVEVNKIDLLHQLNMIGFREPGYLWKIKSIPFIWGPVGGAELMPINFLKQAPLKLKFFMLTKNTLNFIQFRTSLRVRRATANSAFLISAVPSMQALFEDVWGKQSVLMNETGCHTNVTAVAENRLENDINLIWVGKFDFRKQLKLALDVMSELKHRNNLHLHIVGGGNSVEEQLYKSYADSKHINNITWHGKVEINEVNRLMNKSDALFFTSIMEATSTVVLEAIQNRIPVICFDTCGFGSIIDDSVGYKVKLHDYESALKDFKLILETLTKKELNALSENTTLKLRENSWSTKAAVLYSYYEELCVVQ